VPRPLLFQGCGFPLRFFIADRRSLHLEQEIKAQAADPATQVIDGQYRGQPAKIYVTKTQNAIVTDASGNVIAGFRLSSQQLNYVMTTGRLN